MTRFRFTQTRTRRLSRQHLLHIFPENYWEGLWMQIKDPPHTTPGK